MPHTTAGVTINEGIDPLIARDFEDGAAEDRRRRLALAAREDPDGPNAPSHVRGSLIGPQVLVPLDDGELALGRYQGIFFCEFDGPRDREVLVTTLS